MEPQAKLHLIQGGKDKDTALEILHRLHDYLAECEDMILNLPLRQYELINTSVPNINVRNHLTKTRERFECGINALLNQHVA